MNVKEKMENMAFSTGTFWLKGAADRRRIKGKHGISNQTEYLFHEEDGMTLKRDNKSGFQLSTGFLRIKHGGPNGFYFVWLQRKCSSTVAVHLIIDGESSAKIRVSSDRLCFTPENFNIPQTIRVEVIDHHHQTIIINHRLYSLDKSFDRMGVPPLFVKTSPNEKAILVTFGTRSPRKSKVNVASRKSTHSSKKVNGFITNVASGYNFSIVANTSATKGTNIFTWGLNNSGELGDGTMTPHNTPEPICLSPFQVAGSTFQVGNISCGKHHVGLVTTRGTLFTWGNNNYGQLGHGDYTSYLVPREVQLDKTAMGTPDRALRFVFLVQDRGKPNVIQVSCGAFHTLFITHHQFILAMGYNQSGQLGIGHELQQHHGWRSCTPVMIETLAGKNVLQVAAGHSHSACVLNNGDVYTWGCGENGRLGIGTVENHTKPFLLESMKDCKIRARTIRCGGQHTAVVSENDLLYMWGANEFGQLGCGDSRDRTRPFIITLPGMVSDGISDVTLGEFHSVCAMFHGRAFSWGLDLSSNNVDVDQRKHPAALSLEPDEKCVQVSCGWSHTNAIVVESQSYDDDHVSPDEIAYLHKTEMQRNEMRRKEYLKWKGVKLAYETILSLTSSCGRQKTKRRHSFFNVVAEAMQARKDSRFDQASHAESLERRIQSIKKISNTFVKSILEECVLLVLKRRLFLKKQLQRQKQEAVEEYTRSIARKTRVYTKKKASKEKPTTLFYKYPLQTPKIPGLPLRSIRQTIPPSDDLLPPLKDREDDLRLEPIALTIGRPSSSSPRPTQPSSPSRPSPRKKAHPVRLCQVETLLYKSTFSTPDQVIVPLRTNRQANPNSNRTGHTNGVFRTI